MIKGLKLLFVAMFAISLASCSSYSKLLQSKDYQAIYNESLKQFELGKTGRATTMLEMVEPIYEGTEKEDTIQFYLAKIKFAEKSYMESGLMFNSFRKVYNRSPFASEAEYLYGISFYRQAPGYELDQQPTRLAISALEEYIINHPNTPKSDTCKMYIEELTNRLYKKAVAEGETYYKIGAYNSAITVLNNGLKMYPQTPLREKVQYLIVKSNYMFARNSVEKKQRERYYDTIDASYSFLNQFPDSKHSDEVKRLLSNAQKLSKGEQFVTELGETIELSDKEVLRSNRYYEKLFDQVDKGKLTEQQAKDKYSAYIDKIKKRAAKRHQQFGQKPQMDSEVLRQKIAKKAQQE